eukprot:scaffold230729_cov26-Tisochrysis_lutea.AAC.2
MTVCSRCAIVRRVTSAIAERIARWMRWSAAWSIEAVASSSKSTRGRRSVARAKHRSCRSPTDQLEPPSSEGASSSSGRARTAASIPTAASAPQSSPSPYASRGSSDRRKAPRKSTGSCVTIASAREPRNCWSPRVRRSTPSSVMRPASSSTSRKSAEAIVDLPAPVRPTMPTCSPGAIATSKPFSAGGRDAR